jgi:hypothetical protein
VINHRAETMHPDIPVNERRRPRGTVTVTAPSIENRPFSPQDPIAVRSLFGLADLPTIVAIGPFNNRAHAEQLAAAFAAVQRVCRAQLVLLGTGA